MKNARRSRSSVASLIKCRSQHSRQLIRVVMKARIARRFMPSPPPTRVQTVRIFSRTSSGCRRYVWQVNQITPCSA